MSRLRQSRAPLSGPPRSHAQSELTTTAHWQSPAAHLGNRPAVPPVIAEKNLREIPRVEVAPCRAREKWSVHYFAVAAKT